MAILFDFPRTELDQEGDSGGHREPIVDRLFHHSVVEDQVVDLTRRAAAAVGDVDGDLADLVHIGAVGGIGRNSDIRIPGMGDHRANAGEIEGMAAPVITSLGIRTDRGSLEFRPRKLRPVRQNPVVGLVVGLDDPGSRRTLGGHVGERCALVHGQVRESRSAELHHPLEGLLRLRKLQQHVEHQVFGRDVVSQAADQVEANRLRNFHGGETGMDEIGVFGSSDSPGESVVASTHAGMAVGGLDKLPGRHQPFPRDLVTDSRRHAVLGREILNV